MNENRYHVFVDGVKVDELRTWDEAIKVAVIRQPATIQDCRQPLAWTPQRRRTWIVTAERGTTYMGGQDAL